MRFVQSYRGKRPDPASIGEVTIRVADYMATKLVTFHPDDLMDEVISVLLKERISGAPVVDDKNNLVGVISEGDCLKQISESRYHNLPLTEGSVSQYMIKEVKTIDCNTSIFDAASNFLKSRIRRFPVLDDGKLVGQISQKDILKAVLDQKGSTWKK
jgi:CBS domain-containing protein